MGTPPVCESVSYSTGAPRALSLSSWLSDPLSDLDSLSELLPDPDELSDLLDPDSCPEFESLEYV